MDPPHSGGSPGVSAGRALDVRFIRRCAGGGGGSSDGKRYGTFLREEIFLPLGMEDTGFYVHRDKRQRFAQNYAWNEETNALEVFEDCHLGEYYGEDVSFESGGAGLVSTMEDYSHFAQMLLQGGIYNGIRILGEKTVEFMRQDRLSPSQKGRLTGTATWAAAMDV